MLSEEDLACTDRHHLDALDLYRVGKKATGRNLDGVMHHALCNVRKTSKPVPISMMF